MTSYEGKTQKLQLPCPSCGGTSFTWGVVRSMLAFVPPPPKGSWLDTAPRMPMTKARRCDSCGNVQFYTNDSE